MSATRTVDKTLGAGSLWEWMGATGSPVSAPAALTADLSVDVATVCAHQRYGSWPAGINSLMR